jgi:hypothetical protein
LIFLIIKQLTIVINISIINFLNLSVMKKLIILSFVLFVGGIIYAQDVIVQIKGDPIKAKVLEITNETIKYKEFDFQDGPTRNIKISDVSAIVYSNGKTESFNQPQSAKNQTQGQISNTKTNEDPNKAKNLNQNNNQVSIAEIPVEKEIPQAPKIYKGSYFMLGSGSGSSFGGLFGMKAQVRLGASTGFGFHLGVGIIPDADNVLNASFGIKFFPYKGLYIGTIWSKFPIYGPSGDFTYKNGNYQYLRDSYSFGDVHSFIIGVDQVWGSKVGVGFNAGGGLCYDGHGNRYFPIYDLGFLMRF